MNDDRDHLNLLVPRESKPKLDALHRDVQAFARRPINRRQALGLGGLMLVAAQLVFYYLKDVQVWRMAAVQVAVE